MSKYQIVQKIACYIRSEENESLEECQWCKKYKCKDKDKKQYAKLLRYFPLNARLQRSFMSSMTTESMSWHV